MNLNSHLEESHVNPIGLIRDVYEERRRRNPAYSIRAFSRHLGISSGSLSELLSGKRLISIKQARRIAEGLEWDTGKTREFLELVRIERATLKHVAPRSSELPAGTLPWRKPSGERFHQLSQDNFYVIAEWQHFAILSLMETKDFRTDLAWIADRLSISVSEVEAALERLERLGYIERSRGNEEEIRLSCGQLTTSHDVPFAALRRSHVQSLEHVIDHLDHVDVKDRNVTSMTIAVSKKKLPVAKELIQNFRRNLADFLEDGEKDEVYHLNIQLMPVTGLKK